MSMMIAAGQHGGSPQCEPELKKIRVRRIGPGRPRTRPDGVQADKAYASREKRAPTAAVRQHSTRSTVARPE
ncbi:hypothetical protein [Streptomyces sp. NPDC023588]|uniref:hypothetical protein n=1 Tax=Streptomyces sp. NPDC023588 TaxID=3154907 RepID=UPI00340E4853